MKYFVFRNHTIEPFFDTSITSFSGYEDISFIEDADRYVWFFLPSYKTNNKILSQEIYSYLDLLKLVLSKVGSEKMFLAFTMQLIYKANFETFDFILEESINNYNSEIQKISLEHSNVKIINISDFYVKTDISNIIDWRFFHISQMPLNPKCAPIFKSWFSDQIRAIELKRKKCIILDLDNTLWGGILGEDGVNGIQIGETYPGNAYLFFQTFLLELYKGGILLAICSKNNEQDVYDAFEQNPYMLLKKENFVTSRINWNNKAENIREIAEELNIGLDSFVFIDDNPSERELIKQKLPMVETPDFPKQPYLYPVFIQNLIDNYFSIYRLTDDDKIKTQQYKDNAKRLQLKNSFSNINDYIKSLSIKIILEKLSDFNIARFAQMTQKTNQFNLTTKRYLETDLMLLKESGAFLYGIRVKDKFGDNGLAGLTIINIKNKIAEIDTLLLSCRVLGKDIEYEFIKYILYILKKNGITDVFSSYNKTSKNIQVKDFYEKLDFTLIEESDEKKRYAFSLQKYEYKKSNLYKITENL